MTFTTTFGFEAEFDTGANALAERLYDQGMMGSSELHGYHCDCESCYAGPDGYPFHAQRDSSCNGEFITRVLAYDTDTEDGRSPLDIMGALETAAVDVDAEPGFASGCHVHVGIDHLHRQDPYDGRVATPAAHDALWAYLRWERVLVKLAAGRFEAQRDGNNYEVLRNVMMGLSRVYGRDDGYNLAALLRFEENAEDLAETRSEAYRIQYRSDRHSNLNLRTHHPTWEFRLWNSTRSAWRYELWSRLSIAMVDPAVVQVLNEAELVQRVTPGAFERLASYLDNTGHGRAAELVERQSTYARDLAPTAPSTLTVVL